MMFESSESEGDDPLWELPTLTDAGSLSDEASWLGTAPAALDVALEATEVNPLLPLAADMPTTLGDVLQTASEATGVDSMLPQEAAGDEPQRLWQQPTTSQPAELSNQGPGFSWQQGPKPGRARERNRPSDGLRGQDKWHPIQLDDGWQQLAPAFVKIAALVDGDTSTKPMDSKEAMVCYTLVYNMCTQKPPFRHEAGLYERYKGMLRERVATAVLPALRQAALAGPEELLHQVAKQRSKHMIYIRWAMKIFRYLDRFYTVRHEVPKTHECGVQAFAAAVLAASLSGATPWNKILATTALLGYPKPDLDQSLFTLAAGCGPEWSKTLTGRALLGTIVEGSFGLGVASCWSGARPATTASLDARLKSDSDLLGNPYVHWELRYHIATAIFPSYVGLPTRIVPSKRFLNSCSYDYTVEQLLAEVLGEQEADTWSDPLKQGIITSLPAYVQAELKSLSLPLHELIWKGYKACADCEQCKLCHSSHEGEGTWQCQGHRHQCNECHNVMAALRVAERELIRYRLSQCGVFTDPWQPPSAQLQQPPPTSSVPWGEILQQCSGQTPGGRAQARSGGTGGTAVSDRPLLTVALKVRFTAANRPLQLLLLGALITRGQDCNGKRALVGLPLPLSGDVASKIRAWLHVLGHRLSPATWNDSNFSTRSYALQTFHWHSTANIAATSRGNTRNADGDARGEGKRARIE